jgi:general secretion pathway protein F
LSTASVLSAPDVSLDDLVALADEMAALARAGVPLEQGLIEAAKDFSSGSGSNALIENVARRMQSGEGLLHILSTSSRSFPAAYRAVLEAGIRSGRLSAALEGVAASARRLADLRRFARSAVVYPLLVAAFAYVMFLLSLWYLQPSIHQAYEAFRVPANSLNDTLVRWGRTALIWGPLLPLLVALPVLGLWYWTGRALRQDDGLARHLLTSTRLVKYGQMSAFAEMLAMLVDHDVPLGESMVLAADASGDAALGRTARTMAFEIQRGRSVDAEQAVAGGIPPMLAWLLVQGTSQSALVEALKRIAGSYHRRAAALDDRLRLYLPLVLVLCVGGTAVVAYALTLFLPWYDLLFEIASSP